jgi:hypothetical protein
MTQDSRKFPAVRRFVETYAHTKGLDYEAYYRELLERTRAHLEQELTRLKQGELFRKETQFLVAEKTVPPEVALSAYRVVSELRDEGYAADVLADSSYVTGQRLWLSIRLF